MLVELLKSEILAKCGFDYTLLEPNGMWMREALSSGVQVLLITNPLRENLCEVLGKK